VEPASVVETWAACGYYQHEDLELFLETPCNLTFGSIDRVQVIEIRCCKECEDRLRNFIRRLPGVDSVMSDRYHENLMVFGSANPKVVRQAVRHAKNHYPGHHHHNSFWPRILRNAFGRSSFGSLYDMHYYNYIRHAGAAPSWRYGPRKLMYGPDSYGAGRGASHCSPYQPYNNFYNANGSIYY
jgi:hypothetical protein